MRVQVFSDLHLEFAPSFFPTAAPTAEIAVVPGDLGHSPSVLRRFAGWPVPVLYVPGNHEYDRADYDETRKAIRVECAAAGVTLLDRSTAVLKDADGRAIRFVGATRWSDFDLLGRNERRRCSDAAERYLRQMGSSRRGRPLDAAAVRDLGVYEREWLEEELRSPFKGTTVAVTHFGPSGRSADPRYGLVPGSASFCNADDDLFKYVDIWIHGHLHCSHDYTVSGQRPTRVICNPRGYERLGETAAYNPELVIEI
jgi:Calcineurin-like phosphoesterase